MGLDSAKASLRDIQGHIFQADYTNPHDYKIKLFQVSFLALELNLLEFYFKLMFIYYS